MNQKLILFVLLFVFAHNTFASGAGYIEQFSIEDSCRVVGNSIYEKQNTNDVISWHQMFSNLPSDYYKLLKISVSGNELPVIADIFALSRSLMILDQKGWKYQNSLFKKSYTDKKFSDAAVKIGGGGYQFAISAIFATSAVIFNNDAYLKAASNVSEAILSTGLFVQLLKRTTGRQSPAASTEDGGEWNPFPSIKKYQKNQAAFYSFPSGHLSTATAVLTVIANDYPSEKWIKPVGYPLLGALGVSLVNKGMHWYSDLPLAVFLGSTLGNIIAPSEKNSEMNEQSSIKPGFSLLPIPRNRGVDISLVYSF